MNDDKSIKERINDRLEGKDFHVQYSCTTDQFFGWLKKLIKKIKEIVK